MKVVITSNPGVPALEEFRASFPDVSFQVADTPEEQLEQIPDAEVFVGLPSRQVFLAGRRLRWIQAPVTGIDWSEAIPELVKSGVILTNVRGSHANAMADHVFSMILTFAHHTREMWEDQKAHRWEHRKYDGRIIELNGRTMGILGLGSVGMAVARRAHGFGMSVYAVDLSPRPPAAELNEVWGLDHLDELLGISDWFIITAPLTPQTRGLIDKRRTRMLKPGAYLIVVSRAGIVDEDALIEGLRSGVVAGAGLDALAQEPPDLVNPSPFWDMANVLLTPHTSSASPEMYEGRRRACKENLRRYLAGETLLHICDKEAGY